MAHSSQDEQALILPDHSSMFVSTKKPILGFMPPPLEPNAPTFGLQPMVQRQLLWRSRKKYICGFICWATPVKPLSPISVVGLVLLHPFING